MATGLKKSVYQYCIVPCCTSTTVWTPNKRFLIVPRTEELRKKWFKACQKEMGSITSKMYCCEDHFDLDNDIANMVQHKLTGCPLKVKEGVLPSIFDCQKNKKYIHSRKHQNTCVYNDEKDTHHASGCKKRHKLCAVPNCANSSAKTPSKIFIDVPVEDAIRRRWRAIMRQGNFRDALLPLKSLNYVCEDHFDLNNDVENFTQVKQQREKILLKKDVLPHKFECQQKKSSLRKERAWKRERKKIVADLLRAASTESKGSNTVSKPETSSKSLNTSLLAHTTTITDVDQSEQLKVKKETYDVADMKAEAPENIVIKVEPKVVIKEEPKSDSEISESEESELNYVLDMVTQENKEHEVNSSSYSSGTNQDSAMPELSLEFLNERNEETILPDVPTVSGYEEMSSSESSTISNEIQSFCPLKPARILNWEGAYAFKIKVSCEKSGKNSLSVYSDSLNKLFISKDVGFRIFVYAENVPSGCTLRASAIFSNRVHNYDIVTRCPDHAHEDRLKGLKHYYHVVQSISSRATYEMDLATGQFSVVVPYEEPQTGEPYTVYGYKLTCFNSCTSGINRRPFIILYTLEKNGVELGRYALDVKVCACPTRDMRFELLRFQNNSSDSKSEGENFEETKTYSLMVDDADLFKFLNQMKILYESSEFVKCVNQYG